MIAIGCDHGGYLLKTMIIEYLQEENYRYKDYGCKDENKVDYPKYGLLVAEAIRNGECSEGIIVCGTGLGIAISANKVPGIRAATCTNAYMAKMSKEHNDANILALGARVVGKGLALEIVESWLESSFLFGKHHRRVEQIMDIEKKYSMIEL